jgi:hypothetical protein
VGNGGIEQRAVAKVIVKLTISKAACRDPPEASQPQKTLKIGLDKTPNPNSARNTGGHLDKTSSPTYSETNHKYQPDFL